MQGEKGSFYFICNRIHIDDDIIIIKIRQAVLLKMVIGSVRFSYWQTEHIMHKMHHRYKKKIAANDRDMRSETGEQKRMSRQKQQQKNIME